MADGVETTAYLVNESRARRPDLARDRYAESWIPEAERAAVHRLWEGFARTVYEHDDLVVSLRCRAVLDALAETLEVHPDAVLLTCGAGFASHPWLFHFTEVVEVDLPDMIAAKASRAAELTRQGVLPERSIHYVAADLTDPEQRRSVVHTTNEIAAGRPVIYLAEGFVFYLPLEDCRATVTLGDEIPQLKRTIVTYWEADNPVLERQRAWFRERGIPDEAAYLSRADLTKLLGDSISFSSVDDLQRRYLGSVEIEEAGDLVPEHVAVADR
jgi:O-methyltransferase involved in polyketide biosynthesis